MCNPRVLQLITDSLRYWVQEMHVDGFRFDLASTLARELHEVVSVPKPSFIDFPGVVAEVQAAKMRLCKGANARDRGIALDFRTVSQPPRVALSSDECDYNVGPRMSGSGRVAFAECGRGVGVAARDQQFAQHVQVATEHRQAKISRQPQLAVIATTLQSVSRLQRADRRLDARVTLPRTMELHGGVRRVFGELLRMPRRSPVAAGRWPGWRGRCFPSDRLGLQCGGGTSRPRVTQLLPTPR
jgi:hypothetical protein